MPTLVFSLFFAACVTINIYFPAEKVESVAGEIVSEVRGKSSDDQERVEEKEKSSQLRNRLLALWCASARAEDVTTVSNATIRALKEAMKSRYPLLKPHYRSGVLHEGDDGYLSLKDTQALGLRERRNLNTLVDAENRDRNRLYQEVGKALNIDPSQTDRIAEIFAREWQESAP
jgi:hypothetical protein